LNIWTAVPTCVTHSQWLLEVIRPIVYEKNSFIVAFYLRTDFVYRKA